MFLKHANTVVLWYFFLSLIRTHRDRLLVLLVIINLELQLVILQQRLCRVPQQVKLPNLQVLHLASFFQLLELLAHLLDLLDQFLVDLILRDDFLLKCIVPLLELAIDLLSLKQ